MSSDPSTPTVFLNASVIIAGLHSPTGGSARILTYLKKGLIKGVISEIVLDEVLRHAHKIDLTQNQAKTKIGQIPLIVIPPPKKLSPAYQKITLDPGDTHLFESAKDAQADYLVSLDQKHVLTLKDQIHQFHITSPRELIQLLGKHI